MPTPRNTCIRERVSNLPDFPDKKNMYYFYDYYIRHSISNSIGAQFTCNSKIQQFIKFQNPIHNKQQYLLAGSVAQKPTVNRCRWQRWWMSATVTCARAARPPSLASFTAQIKRNNPTRQNNGTEVYTWSASTFYLFFGAFCPFARILCGKLGSTLLWEMIQYVCYWTHSRLLIL